MGVTLLDSDGMKAVGQKVTRSGRYTDANGVPRYARAGTVVPKDWRPVDATPPVKKQPAAGKQEPKGGNTETDKEPTVAQLKERLDELKVEYPARAKHAVLTELLAEAEQAAASGDRETDENESGGGEAAAS